ncbi:MAG: hypothetical protein JNM42_19230 [Propionivibrio sp.]|uniref:hypothetical protein n=1 Tax=Propionivibrio sp. TaxID=2212460 RepID=UPI001A5A1FFF|nr:hypothetical protein [Propionivibrio sp.]MBL8416563.1 hypothetical protein [Propionivibrio sp.]
MISWRLSIGEQIIDKQILAIDCALGAIGLATSPGAILDTVANKVIAQAPGLELWAVVGREGPANIASG